MRGNTPISSARSACATSQTRTATPSSSPSERRARFTLAVRGGAADRVEAALQDIGGGHPIDDLGAAFSGHVMRDHLAGDRRGRQPLVPERDRHVAHRQHVARELAHRLRARAVAAGQRQRQPDHQPADAVPVDQREQRRRVVAKPAPADRFERAGDDEPGVAERGADRLRADIEAQHPAAGRHCGAEFSGVAEQHCRMICFRRSSQRKPETAGGVPTLRRRVSGHVAAATEIVYGIE